MRRARRLRRTTRPTRKPFAARRWPRARAAWAAAFLLLSLPCPRAAARLSGRYEARTSAARLRLGDDGTVNTSANSSASSSVSGRRGLLAAIRQAGSPPPHSRCAIPSGWCLPCGRPSPLTNTRPGGNYCLLTKQLGREKASFFLGVSKEIMAH